MDETSKHNPESILSLSPREHIRLRPGMYIGGTDDRALLQLIYEVVENSIIQAIAGFCTSIRVILSDDATATISDNSTGIPVDVLNDSDQTILEQVFTDVGYLREGSFEVADYAFRLSWWGLGLAVINAVCANLTVEVKRDGYLWQQSYKEGVPESELSKVRALNSGEQTGTTITLTPDFKVFDQNEFDYTALYRRLRELAYLVPGLSITLEDRRTPPVGLSQRVMKFPNGLRDFVKHLNRDYRPLHNPIAIRETVELKKDYKPMGITADIDIALQYSDAPQTIILSYINTSEITDDGVQIDGFKRGLATGIYAVTGKIKIREGFREYDLLHGLTAVISIWHPDPQFASNTRYKLMNSEVHDAVRQLVRKTLVQIFDNDPKEIQRIIDHLLMQKKLRDSRRFGE